MSSSMGDTSGSLYWDAERLYRLLPAIHRLRDAERGAPLRALVEVLAEQALVLDESLEQLYDDLFIETCADWAVPYIGELIGYRPLHGLPPQLSGARAEVANTIDYRQSKGTAAMLERLARDVTGWDARVVEFFQLLATTQHLNHLRRQHHYAPDLRRWRPLERIGGGFDSVAHSAELRRINAGGRYNIPNIGIFVWRLQAMALALSPATPAGDAWRFRISPLGDDRPLFSRPQPQTTPRAGELNVAQALSRRTLDADLAAHYGALLSLEIHVDGAPLPLSAVHVCNLSDAGAAWAHLPETGVAVDPVLGRLAFPPGEAAPERVQLRAHHGFPGLIGGGVYERAAGFAIDEPPLAVLSQGEALQAALDTAASGGAVEVSDSARYAQTPAVSVTAGAVLELRAANGQQPHLQLSGDVLIQGEDGAECHLDGWLISGGALVVPAASGLRRLVLRHCTLVPGLVLGTDGAPGSPGAPSIVVESPDCDLLLEHCVTGALRLHRDARLSAQGSAIDAHAPQAVAIAAPDGTGAAAPLTLVNCTVIGKVHAVEFTLASNTLFDAALTEGDSWTAALRAERRQSGCVRHCWLPQAVRLPRRYRCQPETAAAAAVEQALRDTPGLSASAQASITANVLARVRPLFTDRRYGRPAYLQLADGIATAIATGADDESEIGVWHDLYQPQRQAHLLTRLDEYLRVGLEAAVLHAT